MNRSNRTAVLLLLALFCLPLRSGAETFGLFVSGLGGDENFEESFFETSRLLVEAAISAGVREEALAWLTEDPGRDARIDGRSTREQVIESLQSLSRRMEEGDLLWVVLIGHGSYRDQRSKINLPGPDLTDEQWTAALASVPPDRQLVFVNTASASGGFLETLSGDGRVIVTATKSAGQRNSTVFPTFFAAAFAERTADADQDGFVSVLEAFDYANQEVERHYEDQNLLRTEHALLDDNGDRTGTRDPTSLGGEDGTGDGLLAARLVLGASALSRIERTPENEALIARRADLQRQLDDLRRSKASLPEKDYFDQLQGLLVEIARLDRSLRSDGSAATGDSP